MENHFSNNLAKLRKAKNITQQELADAMSIKRCSIGAYEEGRAIPSIELYLKLSDFLKVDPHSLFYSKLSSEDAYLIVY